VLAILRERVEVLKEAHAQKERRVQAANPGNIAGISDGIQMPLV
jgi:hypothetical protein